ncbi:MAG: hypothetical protein Q4A34_02525 [Candidatus Saccharibacteria bacterium]|nr:hypothetical protein [Candidatus Saccharibacteria bacterium]
MRRRMTLISSIIVLAIVQVATTTPLFATSGIGGRPGNPDPKNPRTQSIFIYELQGGRQKNDQLIVTNGTDKAEDIEVYAVDGTTTATGDIACKERSEPRDGAGSWVSLGKDSVRLNPGQSTPVDFVVNVPEGVDVGEHSACLAVQRKVVDEQPTTGGVVIQTRQAVRMAIIVSGEIHRDIAIEKFTVDNNGGKQQYDIALKNIGNVSADVRVALTVKDGAGNVIYENGGQYPVMANKEKSMRFESQLAPFWGGRYTAELSISYDKEAGKFGVSQNKADIITKHAEPVAIRFGLTLPAWGIIIGGVAVVLGILLWLIGKRRKKSQRRRSGGLFMK